VLYFQVFSHISISAGREVELEIGVLVLVLNIVDIVRHSEDKVFGDEHCAAIIRVAPSIFRGQSTDPSMKPGIYLFFAYLFQL
jgi:hypothetical protein